MKSRRAIPAWPLRAAVLALAGGILVVAACGGSGAGGDSGVAATASPLPAQAYSAEPYRRVLETFVTEDGWVRYRSLKERPEDLETYVAMLGALPASVYETWDEPSRIAFWVNAYNALTLKLIVDHYPIRASVFRSLVFPRNSIRQIPGAWDEIRWTVMGRRLTLDEIEHGILRKEFREPRIHMALVCAARGCPPLRREPYEGPRLDAQLDDQTRRFLSNPMKFRIDRAGGVVYLSPIFQWFGEDFVPVYGATEAFRGKSKAERAVLNFISGYVSEDDAAFLRAGRYRIEYLDYDWTLNEAPEARP